MSTSSSTAILVAQGLAAPNPFRAASKKFERFERVRARLARRHEKACALERARLRAAEALARPLPAGLVDWGILRTRAWRQSVEDLRRAHTRVAASTEELIEAVDRLDSIPTMTLDQCAALASP